MRDIEERKMMRDIHSMAVSLDAISKELKELNKRIHATTVSLNPISNEFKALNRRLDGGDIDEKDAFDSGYEKPLGTLM